MSNTCVELAILHLKDKVANPIGELEKSSEYQRALAVLKKQPGLSHFRVGRWQENMNDVYWLVGGYIILLKVGGPPVERVRQLIDTCARRLINSRMGHVGIPSCFHE